MIIISKFDTIKTHFTSLLQYRYACFLTGCFNALILRKPKCNLAAKESGPLSSACFISLIQIHYFTVAEKTLK